MGTLEGKVAFITGGARGQGRAHAVTLARAGADIAVCDIADDLDTVPYPLGTKEDLAQTVWLVEAEGRRCLAVQADVRSLADMQAAVDRTLAEYGHIDILLANAGIASNGPVASMSEAMWREMIDVNLTGVFTTFRAVVPHMIGRGTGRIVATSSIMGRMGGTNCAHYAAAKWGVLGLVKSLALEVAGHGITVNAVLPSGVDTPMLNNPATYKQYRPDLENPTRADVAELWDSGAGLLAPEDVSRAIMFLISDEGGYLNGEALALSAGMSAGNAT